MTRFSMGTATVAIRTAATAAISTASAAPDSAITTNHFAIRSAREMPFLTDDEDDEDDGFLLFLLLAILRAVRP